MLLVLWIGHGFDKQIEAGNATDVFRGRATGTVDIAGVFDSGIGIADRLDRDRVLPVVSEVVGVGQLCDAPINERAELDALDGVGSVPLALPLWIW